MRVLQDSMKMFHSENFMKLKILEKDIKRQILQYMRARGALIFVHDNVGIYNHEKGVYQLRRGPERMLGVADLIGIYKGKFIAIEVKQPGRRLTSEQAVFLAQVKDQGGISFMATSVEDTQLQLDGQLRRFEGKHNGFRLDGVDR